MNVNEIKNSQNQLEAKIKDLAQKVFGSCSVGVCDFSKQNGVSAEIEVHSLGTKIVIFFSDECLEETNSTKSLEIFRQTDNLQLCVITNGILKQERVILFVVDDKEFPLANVPQRIKGAVGVSAITQPTVDRRVIVQLTHPIEMIVGEILTSEGKRKQVKEVNRLHGRLSKSINGNRTIVHLEIEKVE